MLQRLAIRGAGITVLAQFLSLATQIIAIVVLSRLLVAEDFGLVAMVTAFSVLLVSFGQIGLQEAIAQRERLEHFLVSNLFWINLASGVFLTFGFAAAGALLAAFYGDPRLQYITGGMSLTIVLTSVSVLHLGLLKRTMQFSAVALNDILARIMFVAVSIFLAWEGLNYWALVGGAVAQSLSTSIGAFALCRWVPAKPRRVDGIGSIIRYAINVNASWNIDYFARNLDTILLGWWFGPGSLGFYKKAYDLFALPANQLLSIFPVTVSTLSRLQGKPIEYRRYLFGTISILACLGMGVGASLTLVGKDMVHLILGPGWEETAEIFMFFGPGIGIMLVYRTFGLIHLSIGTTARFLRWRMVEFAVVALLFLAALPWGSKGLAAAWTVSYWALIVPTFWYAGKPIQLSVTSILATFWRYALASLVAYGGCILIMTEIHPLAALPGYSGSIGRILMTCLLFGVLYAGAIIILHRGFGPLRQFIWLLKDLVPWIKVHEGTDSWLGRVMSTNTVRTP